MYMYMCIHVHECVCVYECLCVYLCIHVHVCVCRVRVTGSGGMPPREYMSFQVI